MRMVPKAGQCLVAVVLSITLTACQTLGPGGLPTSRAMPELSSVASQAIADDMTTRLTEVAAPQTVEVKGDDTAFATALEASLTRAGYMVAPADQKANSGAGLRLAYVVEEFEGDVLARLSTEAADLGRVYRVTGDTVEPTSPVSIKRRD